MKQLQDVIDYLKLDMMKHVVHLKQIEAYADHLTWHYEQGGSEVGVLLLFPTRAIPFDAVKYPNTAFVVFLAASSPALAERVVRLVPRDQPLIFKLVDDLTREAVLSTFPVTRVTSYTSYTSSTSYTTSTSSTSYTTREQVYRIEPGVVVSHSLDERLLPLYQGNGYTRPELEHYFEQGSTSYSVFDADGPLSTCFIFKNYDVIWEIGGVYTLPEKRGQGLAKRVVRAALCDVLEKGRTPRYQVVETNLASIHLAQKLGLQRFTTTQHFLYQPVDHQ